jgi:hypothetical protein
MFRDQCGRAAEFTATIKLQLIAYIPYFEEVKENLIASVV